MKGHSCGRMVRAEILERGACRIMAESRETHRVTPSPTLWVGGPNSQTALHSHLIRTARTRGGMGIGCVEFTFWRGSCPPWGRRLRREARTCSEEESPISRARRGIDPALSCAQPRRERASSPDIESEKSMKERTRLLGMQMRRHRRPQLQAATCPSLTPLAGVRFGATAAKMGEHPPKSVHHREQRAKAQTRYVFQLYRLEKGSL